MKYTNSGPPQRIASPLSVASVCGSQYRTRKGQNGEWSQSFMQNTHAHTLVPQRLPFRCSLRGGVGVGDEFGGKGVEYRISHV